jgi:hypothetical protein
MSRNGHIERMNYYSDPRTIAGMSTTYNYATDEGEPNWDLATEAFECLICDDELENDEIQNFVNNDGDLQIGFLLWLKAKFPEFHAIPTKEELIGSDDVAMPTVIFKTAYQVCGICQGRGKHVNPSIDCGGITESEWSEWGHEEQDNYMNGSYDQQCAECKGKRVVLAMTESKAGSFHEWIARIAFERTEESYESAREQAEEMKWGC